MSPRFQFVGPALACMLAAVFLLARRGLHRPASSLMEAGSFSMPGFCHRPPNETWT